LALAEEGEEAAARDAGVEGASGPLAWFFEPGGLPRGLAAGAGSAVAFAAATASLGLFFDPGGRPRGLAGLEAALATKGLQRLR
jgi:hypothetical protein